jgi:hypothetical protein
VTCAADSRCRLLLFGFGLWLGFCRLGLVADDGLERAYAERRAFLATNGNGDGAESHDQSFGAMPQYATLTSKTPCWYAVPKGAVLQMIESDLKTV